MNRRLRHISWTLGALEMMNYTIRTVLHDAYYRKRSYFPVSDLRSYPYLDDLSSGQVDRLFVYFRRFWGV